MQAARDFSTQASQVKVRLENNTAKNLAIFAQFEAGLFLPEDFKKAHGKLVEDLERFLKSGLKAPEAVELYDFFPSDGLEKVVLVVLPKDLQKISVEHPYANIAAKLAKHLLGWKKHQVKVLYPEEKGFTSQAESFFEGLFLGLYNPALYKKNAEDALQSVAVLAKQDLKKEFAEAEAIHQGVYLARNVGNQSSNDFTPSRFHEEALKLAKDYKFNYQFFDKAAILANKLGCFYSVAQGSDHEAYLCMLEYKGGKKEEPPVLIVGKGITFDTGGYSLKPAASMEEMKFDMCGGAAVLGVMKIIGLLQPKVNVVAFIPTCENMISGHATRPGDIVQAYNGKTVEVINTDAEGRLILADALAYGVEKYNPKLVIDLATLTGACVVALGKHYSGLFSNSKELSASLVDLGKTLGEGVWPMPIDKEYAEDLKGVYSDLKNVGSRWGGAITAAKFLENFVDQLPWAHLDIAGTAWDAESHPLHPKKGATGVGVRLVYRFLAEKAQQFSAPKKS